MNKFLRGVTPAAVLCLLAQAGVADTSDAAARDDPVEIPEPRVFVTEHRGTFNGQRIDYRVTAGDTYLADDDGTPRAAIFSFAYTVPDAGPERPVTFIWNGGPGSASLWLHMGTFGPKRVVIPSDARHPGPPPYRLSPATETLLDVTDLVFVDPVGTGFSRALGDTEPTEFWGLGEDAKAMADFIQTWTDRNNRWNAPKFLLGESFGTTRAAAVANLLEGARYRIALSGLIFVSQALDYSGSSPYVDHNLVAYVTYLPTMAATAWYHQRIEPRPDDLTAFVAEARVFATDRLLPALFKGNTLPGDERAEIRERLAYFTGLDPDYIDAVDLRINGFRFAKELLRDRGLSVGLADGRYTRAHGDPVAAEIEADASSEAMYAAFKGALMTYLRDELEVDTGTPYLAPADPKLSPNWRWRTVPDDEAWEPAYVNTAPDLAAALRINPSLRVLVASGYYDLITPFFDAEYTLTRHGIGADRVEFTYYPGGHMMYVHEPSRAALLADVRQFLEKQLAR